MKYKLQEKSFLLQKLQNSPTMAFREAVRFEVNYHLVNLHEDTHQHLLGPNTTWIRQPDNHLTRVNNTHFLARNLKEKLLQARPDYNAQDVVITRIDIKGTPLFGHELEIAPLYLLQTDDVVDVFLMVKTNATQRMSEQESEEESSSENDSNVFQDSQQFESQDLLAEPKKKEMKRKI